MSEPGQPETPEQRRARKAAEREANAARLQAELESEYLRPLPERMSFLEMQAEHGRLRQKIMEFQSLVITGKLDPKKAQEFERRMVEQIHAVEEKARGGAPAGQHVPKRGE
jgi:hypothetical protein